MEGKSSILCFAGPENAMLAINCSPIAIATEPVRLEVSTTNINGFFVILYALLAFLLLFCAETLHFDNKKFIKKDFFICPFVKGFFILGYLLYY